MKTIITGITVSLLIAGNALAADAPATAMPPLAEKHSCTSCHAVDERVVGPAWRDIAKKYREDPTAAAKLQTKVSEGGRGVWGTMPMPANDPAPKTKDAPAQTRQEDIRALVQFILKLQ